MFYVQFKLFNPILILVGEGKEKKLQKTFFRKKNLIDIQLTFND